MLSIVEVFNMGLIDIILIVIVGIGAISGFAKGFIHQLVSIIGLIVGFFVAGALYQVAAEKMSVYVNEASMTVLQVIAFISIWIIVPLLFAIIASMLTRAVEWLSLGVLNRFLGLLLGGVKWVLILGLLINVLDYIDYDDSLIHRAEKEQSKLYYPIKKSIGGFFPAAKEAADEYIYT